MSKNCMMRREKDRIKKVKKHFKTRQELKKVIKSLDSSLEEKELAQAKMQKLPRRSIPAQRTNRCWKTGRARGVEKMIGVCRNVFREMAMNGLIPGLRKASW